ncbi:M28 family metallopeptidase [Flavimarina sp. Hel_I_48]|uniref:M28 family metallopeptidase n=1 Tax=Flavimarina sp. Hel_I_48 TaxID=1392488 RepID=UPI0004DFCD05|nr:M28 family metallopeptidase [Flavimarina sp. Hel_I_48]
MKTLMLSATMVASMMLTNCGSQMTADDAAKNVDMTQVDPAPFAETITAEETKEMLYTYASDEFEGRETGEPGQKKAVNYIRDFYKEHDIPSAMDSTYFQTVPATFFKEGSGIKDSENVAAFIKGSTKPNEYVVISAHLDHVGVNDDGQINNGADDDGSGTVAVMEIAEAFQEAVKQGYRPQRSILFLHVTGEEKGLVGSRYYVEHPIFSLDSTVVDLNIDMIGRQDAEHSDDENYVYLIGSDKLSQGLHDLSEATNEKYMNMDLDYTFNDENDPNRFYYRSDHYNFAKNGVPIIFYFNGVHEDYHKPGDTPDKINYPLLTKRAQLVFYTAWNVANQEKRISADKE